MGSTRKCWEVVVAIPVGFLFKSNTRAACVANRKGQEKDWIVCEVWLGESGGEKPVLFPAGEIGRCLNSCEFK